MLDRRSIVSTDIIKSANLDPNGYLETLNSDLNIGICKETPGGSSLNTIRVISQRTDLSVTFIGAIGNDAISDNLTQLLQNDRAKYFFEKIDTKTAHCTVLINNNERSLITYLGAANKLTVTYLEEHLEIVEQAELLYLCGFFVCSMPYNAEWILKHLNNQRLIFNLSSSSILENIEKNLLIKIIRKAFCIIGNYEEMKMLIKIMFEKDSINKENDIDRSIVVDYDENFKNEVYEIQKHNEYYYEKIQELSKMNGQILICTNNENPIVYFQDGERFSNEVNSIKMDTLDTCGAGDYFAAGVIAGFYMDDKLNLRNCVSLGREWAQDYILRNTKSLEDIYHN